MGQLLRTEFTQNKPTPSPARSYIRGIVCRAKCFLSPLSYIPSPPDRHGKHWPQSVHRFVSAMFSHSSSLHLTDYIQDRPTGVLDLIGVDVNPY